jgi:hypothetical protein
VPKAEAPDDRVRIEIAFKGGQTIGALIAPESARGFKEAIDRGDGSYELPAEDGTYVIPLGAIVYVKQFSKETQIGFGLTA